MTDREMLELAAQAAGVKLLFDPHGTPRDCTGAHPDANIFAMPVWDPKNDNETALRLAESAQLLIDLQRQVAKIERLTKIEGLTRSSGRVKTALVHHAAERAIAIAVDLLVALKHETYGKQVKEQQ
jgi:hypothetical protein